MRTRCRWPEGNTHLDALVVRLLGAREILDVALEVLLVHARLLRDRLLGLADFRVFGERAGFSEEIHGGGGARS